MVDSSSLEDRIALDSLVRIYMEGQSHEIIGDYDFLARDVELDEGMRPLDVMLVDETGDQVFLEYICDIEEGEIIQFDGRQFGDKVSENWDVYCSLTSESLVSNPSEIYFLDGNIYPENKLEGAEEFFYSNDLDVDLEPLRMQRAWYL